MISQRAIALAVLVSGCVCDDALMTYSAPADPDLPAAAPDVGPVPPVSEAMPAEWSSALAITTPARLEVVPVEVSTLVGLDFEMRARMFDASGNMIPILDDGEIEWALSPTTGATITPTAPGRVQITVHALGATYSLSAFHPIHGFSSKAQITPVQLESSTAEDWIAGTHDAREPPMIALVDGTWASFDDDKLFAFVGGGSLGTIKPGCSTIVPANCGEATSFATTRSLNRKGFSWSASCDLVDRRNAVVTPVCAKVGSGPLEDAVKIPLKVWVFATSALNESIRADLGFFKNALRDAWGGAVVADDIEQTGDTRTITLDFTSGGVVCAQSVFDQLVNEFQMTGLAADKATVVFVEQLYRRGSDGLSELYWTGYACPYDDQYGAVTFVDWHRKQLTTTSHEVGHVLGPWDLGDNWGHMEVVGTPASNLMMGTQQSVDFPRWTLTLGQVYRYSLDKHAIINRNLTTLDRCPLITVPGTKCPSIIKDVP